MKHQTHNNNSKMLDHLFLRTDQLQIDSESDKRVLMYPSEKVHLKNLKTEKLFQCPQQNKGVQYKHSPKQNKQRVNQEQIIIQTNKYLISLKKLNSNFQL